MTLICLISGQLAPNLLSVIHFNPTQVILVHTEETYEYAVRFQDLLSNSYQIPHIKKWQTRPFDPEKIQERALALKETLAGQEILLNYTGGTKPMAIQFVRLFEQAGAQLLYVDTQQECFWLTKEKETKEQPFDFHFGLPTLFNLQKVDLRAQKDENEIEQLSELSDFLLNERRENTFDELTNIIKAAVSARTENKNISSWNPMVSAGPLTIETPQKYGQNIQVSWRGRKYPQKNKSFWLDYFTGGWFEQWTFRIMKEIDVYDDVRCNVTIRPNEMTGNNDIKNEIDVAAICNTIPVFLECKTGRVDQKSITNLKSMVDEYGPTYSEGVLVCFYPLHDNVLREKVKDYNLMLIEGPKNLKTQLERIHEEMVVRT